MPYVPSPKKRRSSSFSDQLPLETQNINHPLNESKNIGAIEEVVTKVPSENVEFPEASTSSASAETEALQHQLSKYKISNESVPLPSPKKQDQIYPTTSVDPNNHDIYIHRAYSEGNISNDDNLPLSLSFIKKPSRSCSMTSDIDIDKIMKQNTILNSRSFEYPNIHKGITNVGTPMSEENPMSPLCSETSLHNNMLNHISSPLVRKKSGELVKSSLKLNNVFKSSGSVSVPTTPTFKQVHFGNDISVKYFKEKDKPIFLSADNSPYTSESECESADEYEENSDDHETGDAESNADQRASKRMFNKLLKASKDYIDSESVQNLERFKNIIRKWNLDTNLLKGISYRDKIDCEIPVFLETCFLNLDKTSIVGQIAVKNISFAKNVKIVYSCDNWKHVMEVDAKYTSDLPRILKRAGYDRFVFRIPTSSLIYSFLKFNPSLSSSFLKSPSYCPKIDFCIKYTTGGQDFWDNNHLKNYSLVFIHEKFLHKIKKGLEAIKAHDQKQTSTESYFSLKKNAKYEKMSKDTSKDSTGKTFQLEGMVADSEISKGDKTDSIPDRVNSLKKSKSFSKRSNDRHVIPPSKFFGKRESPFERNNNLPETVSKPGSVDLKVGVLKDNVMYESGKNSHIKNENEYILDKLRSFHAKIGEKMDHIDGKTSSSSQLSIADQATDNVEVKSQPRKPPTDKSNDVHSASYKDLLEKFCFYKEPSTVSSFLKNDEDSDSTKYNDMFY